MAAFDPIPVVPVLRLHTVPHRQGMAWVRQGFATLLRRPLGFMLLFLSFLFVALFVASLPLVGPVLMMMALPLLSLGFMAATRGALRGAPVHPGQYAEFMRGQRPRRMALLQLCVAYGVASVVIVGLSNWADGGRFAQLQLEMMEQGGQPGPLLADARLQFGLLLRLVLTTLLALPFWHAPALVWWGHQKPAQALFSSWIACWRNRGAMIVYGLAWGALMVGFMLLAGMLFSAPAQREFAAMLTTPLGLLLSCAFYVSLYFTFRDSFGFHDPAAQPAAAAGDDAGPAPPSGSSSSGDSR